MYKLSLWIVLMHNFHNYFFQQHFIENDEKSFEIQSSQKKWEDFLGWKLTVKHIFTSQQTWKFIHTILLSCVVLFAFCISFFLFMALAVGVFLSIFSSCQKLENELQILRCSVVVEWNLLQFSTIKRKQKVVSKRWVCVYLPIFCFHSYNFCCCVFCFWLIQNSTLKQRTAREL